MSEWIACKDRLPPNDTEVITFGRYYDNGDESVGALFYQDNHWISADEGLDIEPFFNVTHWMPMPAPPPEPDK